MRVRGGFAAARPLGPLGLLVLLLGASAACEELPDLSVNRCGDGIIDPATEDCDGERVTLGNVAYDCQGCRLKCDPHAVACSDADASDCCPPGWGCGEAGVCAEAKGEFVPLGAPIESLASRVEAADFDGDGQADVATFGDEIKLHFFAGGVLSATFSTPSRSEQAVIGRLTAGARSDIAVPSPFGLAVLRGQPDSRLEPTAYSLDVDFGDESRIIVLDARPTQEDGGTSGDEILIFGHDPDLGGVLKCVEDGATLFTDPAFPYMPSQLAGSVPVGQIIGGAGSPCEEFALAFRDAATIFVMSPCNGSAWSTSSLAGTVTLPAPYRVRDGVKLLHLNDDDYLDLFIHAHAMYGEFTRLFVAMGKDPTLGLFDPPVAFDLQGYGGPVLAADYLDGDKIADFVGETQVFLSGSGAHVAYPIPTQLPASDVKLKQVVVADLNHDTRPDLIASFSDDHTEFLNNAADGVFNRFAIQTTGPVSNLTVGDFDGDLIDDVAFSEATPEAAQAPEATEARGELAVLFGRGAGAPEPPIHIGQFSLIEGIVTGRDLLPLGTLGDAMDDLVALWKPGIAGKQRQAFFPASFDRRLQAPFIFVDTGHSPFNAHAIFSPIRIAIGNFDGDTHADVAALTDEQEGQYRLWRLLTTVEAQINVEGVTWTTIDPLLQWRPNPRWDATLLGAVNVCDLPNDTDEVVFLVPSASGLDTELWIGEVQGKQWKIDPRIVGLPVPSWAMMQIEDVDGDGCRDIVALSSASGAEELVVLWNRPAGGFADNAISRLDLRKYAEEAEISPTAVVCAELTNAPGRTSAWKEILLLTTAGASLVYPDPGSPILSEPSQIDLPRGSSVAAGDVDHDGLPDLAILSEGALRVFRSSPRIP